MTNTYVGSVIQGSNTSVITGDITSWLLGPVGGVNPLKQHWLPPTLTSDLMGPPFGNNDVYYQWTGSGYNITTI